MGFSKIFRNSIRIMILFLVSMALFFFFWCLRHDLFLGCLNQRSGSCAFQFKQANISNLRLSVSIVPIGQNGIT